MEFYGIREIECEATIIEVERKKKQKGKFLLNAMGWCLTVLNLVAYALLASKII